MNAIEAIPLYCPQGEGALQTRHGSMDQLFVVHRSGSIVLFSHHFDADGTADQQSDDVHGAAIDAMDKLLGEILSNDGHIRQIVYGDKVLSFTYGQHCSFILISEMHMGDGLPRLARFAAAFEREFSTKLEKDFNIDMNAYDRARKLVDTCFF
jgi:hypothetical protein